MTNSMTKNAIPTHHMALIHVIKERIKTAEILDSTMISAVFIIYAILDATGFEPPDVSETLEKKGVSGTSSKLFSNLFSKTVD